jgi:hypothetical protein
VAGVSGFQFLSADPGGVAADDVRPGRTESAVRQTNPQLFLGTALAYLALALLGIAGSYWRRLKLTVQAHLQMLVDLAA